MSDSEVRECDPKPINSSKTTMDVITVPCCGPMITYGLLLPCLIVFRNSVDQVGAILAAALSIYLVRMTSIR